MTVPAERIESAANEVIAFLQDAVRRTAAAEHNFRAARERYSFEALENILRGIFARKGLSWN